jgi:hypothetical protein
MSVVCVGVGVCGRERGVSTDGLHGYVHAGYDPFCQDNQTMTYLSQPPRRASVAGGLRGGGG